MRISDWSSDVCSSDLVIQLGAILAVIVLYWRRFWHVAAGLLGWKQGAVAFTRNILLGFLPSAVIGLFVYKMVKAKIGRASCRERVCQYVEISVVAVSLKKKTIKKS